MTDSWWLKIKRAQRHMVEVDRFVDAYASRHHYEFTRVRYPKGQRKVGYRVHFMDQPDPMLAVMVGDFIHNLRSALDHIIVASVPKREQSNATSFPFTFVDLFAKGVDGQFVVNDAEARDGFERAIRGVHPNLRALVIRAQPYHFRDDAHRWGLGMISRLENADKHRRLISVAGGLLNPIVTWRYGGESRVAPYDLGPDKYLKQGTVVGWTWDHPLSGDPTEVEMEIRGTAEVLIQIAPLGGNKSPESFRLRVLMLGMLRDMRKLLRSIEPFVLR